MTSLIEKLKKQQKAYSDKKEKVEYLDVYTSGPAGVYKGMFYAGADQIYVFTSDGSTQNRSELELDATLVHESGHREGADVYHLAMSPEQIFRVDRFDEVGQKIRELVLRRNEYLKTGNIDVFNDDSKDFSYYADAVKNGEITPFESARDIRSFDREMSFIMNKTMEEWNNKYGKFYEKQSAAKAKEYFCRVGKYARSDEQNYNKALERILTIGGVNFNKYRETDFKCNSDEILKISETVQKGNEAEIAALRQELIDEGIAVIPSLQATNRQKKKGYLTRHNPKSVIELEEDSGEQIVTVEEQIENLKELGLIDESETPEDLEDLKESMEDFKYMYKKMPKKKKIPDLSDDKFIAKPAEKREKTSQDRAGRLKELRGLGTSRDNLGGGAGRIMRQNVNGSFGVVRQNFRD